MFTLKSLFVSLFFLATISEILSLDYLHLDNNGKDLKLSNYYLSADGGPNTAPNNELKRTQRSFWKKLFKNGLFGESDNCCNNCNYNVGNGDNYNPITSPLLPFQPFSPLPIWRPLQPLFGPINYDNYGRSTCNGMNSNSYGNTPNYGMNTYVDNSPTSYDNSVPPATEPVYEIPSELPSPETDYKIETTPVVEDTYETSSNPRPTENSYNVPETSTFANGEISKTVQHYTSEKIPQILYQPIIYVSPQYQDKEALKQPKNEELKYSEGPKNDYKLNIQSYDTDTDTESIQPSNVSELDNKNSVISNSKEEDPEIQNSDDILPYSKKYINPHTQQPFRCLSHPPINPSISTVSTVYNVISPSLLHSLMAGKNPYTATTGVCANNGPSRYMLYPSNIAPLDSSLPAHATKLSLSPSPIQDSVPAVHPSVPSTHTYTQPIHLTPDDQPYRVCPELFQEYQRKLNTLLPYGSRTGNTFINAQLISY